MSDPRALAGRHAPDLHGAQPVAADVRRRHDADLQYALRGLDANHRERFLADYAEALRAFERERALVADPGQPPPLPAFALRGWTPLAALRARSDLLDRRSRVLAEREAAAHQARHARGTPVFSPATLAVFEEKARIDHEIRRREARVMAPWQWAGLVLLLLSIAIVAIARG
jgi:hypothetical protein